MSDRLDDPVIQEILEDLRGLVDAFDDTRPDQMTAVFYVHAFNEFSVCVRALIDAIDQSQTALECALPAEDPGADERRADVALGEDGAADQRKIT